MKYEEILMWIEADKYNHEVYNSYDAKRDKDNFNMSMQLSANILKSDDTSEIKSFLETNSEKLSDYACHYLINKVRKINNLSKVPEEDRTKINNLKILYKKMNSWKYDHIFYKNSPEFKNMLRYMERTINFYDANVNKGTVDMEELRDGFKEIEHYTTEYIKDKKYSPSTDAGKGRLKLAIAALYTLNPAEGLKTIDRIATKRKEDADYMASAYELEFGIENIPRQAKSYYLSLDEIVNETGIKVVSMPAEKKEEEQPVNEKVEIEAAPEEAAPEEASEYDEDEEIDVSLDRSDLVVADEKKPIPEGLMCNHKEYISNRDIIKDLMDELEAKFKTNSIDKADKMETYAKYFLFNDVSEEFNKLGHEEYDYEAHEKMNNLMETLVFSKNLLNRDPKLDVINRAAFDLTMRDVPRRIKDSEIYKDVYKAYKSNVAKLAKEADVDKNEEPSEKNNTLKSTKEYKTIVGSLEKSLKNMVAASAGISNINEAAGLLARYINTRGALLSIKELATEDINDFNLAELERQSNKCKSMDESTEKIKNSPELKAVLAEYSNKDHFEKKLEQMYSRYAVITIDAMKNKNNDIKNGAHKVAGVNADPNEVEVNKSQANKMHK